MRNGLQNTWPIPIKNSFKVMGNSGRLRYQPRWNETKETGQLSVVWDPGREKGHEWENQWNPNSLQFSQQSWETSRNAHFIPTLQKEKWDSEKLSNLLRLMMGNWVRPGQPLNSISSQLSVRSTLPGWPITNAFHPCPPSTSPPSFSLIDIS